MTQTLMKTIRTQIALATIGTFTGIVGAIALSPAAQAACAGACIPLSANTAYTQDFNTLANSGNSNTTLPTGWYFAESGSSANTTYAANNGNNDNGNTYSYGSTGSTERAFGSLTSSSLTPNRLGAQFQISSALPVISLNLSYVGEQWRAADATGDGLTFEYSTNATSLITGTWTNVAALNFTPPIVEDDDDDAGRLDGNLAANRRARSGLISLAVPLNNGATFWIRWVDTNRNGGDQGMAIDDFSITARPIPTPALLPALIGFGVSALRRRKQSTAP